MCICFSSQRTSGTLSHLNSISVTAQPLGFRTVDSHLARGDMGPCMEYDHHPSTNRLTSEIECEPTPIYQVLSTLQVTAESKTLNWSIYENHWSWSFSTQTLWVGVSWSIPWEASWNKIARSTQFRNTFVVIFFHICVLYLPSLLWTTRASILLK